MLVKKILTLLGSASFLLTSAPLLSAQGNSLITKAKHLMADSLPEDTDEIHRLLTRSIRDNPEDPEAYVSLARHVIWKVNNGLEGMAGFYFASRLAETVDELRPDAPTGQVLRAEILTSMGRVHSGNRVFKKAKTHYPEHPDILYYECAYGAKNNPSRAIQAGELALAKGASPDDLIVPIILAYKKKFANDRGSLLVELKALVEKFPHRWTWHHYGMALKGMGQYALAEEALEKAITFGNDVESRLHLALLYIEAYPNTRKALQLLEEIKHQLYSRNQKKIRVGAVRLIHWNLAKVYLQTKDDAKAVKAAVASYSHGEEDPKTIFRLQDIFHEEERIDLFIASLRKIISNRPLSLTARRLLANVYMREKQFSHAKTLYSQALSLTPDDAFLLSGRAHSHYHMKNFQAALQDFTLASKLKPDDGHFMYNRACMLSLLGRVDEAYSTLQNAIKFDSSLLELAQTDSDLANLKNSQIHRASLRKIGVLGSFTVNREVPGGN